MVSFALIIGVDVVLRLSIYAVLVSHPCWCKRCSAASLNVSGPSTHMADWDICPVLTCRSVRAGIFGLFVLEVFLDITVIMAEVDRVHGWQRHSGPAGAHYFTPSLHESTLMRCVLPRSSAALLRVRQTDREMNLLAKKCALPSADSSAFFRVHLGCMAVVIVPPCSSLLNGAS